MKRPECLHIPTLREGEKAKISWGEVAPNANYILERIFNESFSQALSGYTWDNIDSSDKSWNQHDQNGLSWNQMEAKSGKGRTWERLDYEQLNWSQFESIIDTWKQFDGQEINFEIFKGGGAEKAGVEDGTTWLELDGQNKTWGNFDAAGHSWSDAEKITFPGISWNSIESRWLTFQEWETKGLTFEDLDTQERIKQHRGIEDLTPIGAESAMYRIKAYDPDGNESDYLTSSPLPVIPIFYRNSIVQYPVKAGKRYRFLIKAQDVNSLDHIKMNLCYHPSLLELTDFAAHSTTKVLKAGNYAEAQLCVYSVFPGKVWFQSTKQVKQDECFTGSITLVEFKAKETGTATVSLS